MARIAFPEGFRFGAATAAFQIEGAPAEDGKGPSIWDRFSHEPGRIRTGDTADRACDSYHRWGEDVELLRRMNLRSYRFSISWPRIQPEGRGPANPRGLDYYRRLCESLLEAGIRPFPTLYHWDLPLALEERGGWPERDTAGRFADYADHVARGLGDLVHDWLLFNEPQVFVILGYALGIHAPGRKDPDAALRASHVVNLAQAEAFRAIKARDAAARVGSAFNMSSCEPADPESAADRDAAERFHRATNLWYLEPALRGRYPEGAFERGLPAARMGIEEGDLERLRAPLDVIGINLYTRTPVRAVSGDPLGIGALPVGFGRDEGPRTDFGWEVWHPALHDLVMRISREYHFPEIEITENGASYGEGPGPDGVIRDARRIDFLRGALTALHRAIEEGARVVGYHHWSLLDNFEWTEGYAQRFGLSWVDFRTCERTLKESGRIYGEIAAEAALEADEETLERIGRSG